MEVSLREEAIRRMEKRLEELKKRKNSRLAVPSITEPLEVFNDIYLAFALMSEHQMFKHGYDYTSIIWCYKETLTTGKIFMLEDIDILRNTKTNKDCTLKIQLGSYSKDLELKKDEWPTDLDLSVPIGHDRVKITLLENDDVECLFTLCTYLPGGPKRRKQHLQEDKLIKAGFAKT